MWSLEVAVVCLLAVLRAVCAIPAEVIDDGIAEGVPEDVPVASALPADGLPRDEHPVAIVPRVVASSVLGLLFVALPLGVGAWWVNRRDEDAIRAKDGGLEATADNAVP